MLHLTINCLLMFVGLTLPGPLGNNFVMGKSQDFVLARELSFFPEVFIDTVTQ